MSDRFRTRVTIPGPELAGPKLEAVLDQALAAWRPGVIRIGSWMFVDGVWECAWEEASPEWQ